MSVTKRISTGNYNLTTPAGNVVVTTDTMHIYGNLYVQGNTTVVNVANISTADPTITLNSNISVPFEGNSGLEIYRGPSNYIPALYWNETTESWQLATNIANAATYSDIATVATSGTGTVGVGNIGHFPYYATNSDTVIDAGPNLTWNGTSILTVTGNVITTNLQVNNTFITATTSGAGGTGINFDNGSQTGELISKQKAIAYSIIFG